MKKLCASLAGALMAAVLLIAGCSNPVQDAADQSGLKAGTGKVLLSLSGQTFRTLVPEFDNLSYTISFEGGSEVDPVTDWDGTGTKAIILPAGTWTITVTEKNGETKVSEGSVQNVEIEAGKTTEPVSVTLKPEFGTDNGTFSYSTGTGGIDFSGVESATLTLIKIGETTPVTKNLLDNDEKSDAISLAPGSYLLTVKLVKRNGEQAIKSEAVHIYAGKTTAIGSGFVFNADDFAMVELAAFTGLTSDGKADGSPTLTLTFDKEIPGLSADDITITPGDTGAEKGELTPESGGTYTLTLTGITKPGTITVAVAKKGYEFKPSSKTVEVSRSYRVSFDLDGGTLNGNGSVDNQTIAYGGKVTAPGDAAKTGHNFRGWFNGDAKWDFEKDTVSGDLTLKAGWDVVMYTVTFDSKGGSAVTPQSIAQGGKATAPSDVSKTGYTLEGWYREDTFTTKWNFDDPVTEAITLYAKWTAISYTITYHLNGGTNHPSNPPTYTIESAAITLEAPTKANAIFGGWYTNSDLTAPAGSPAIPANSTENKIFYAKWTATGNGGISIDKPSINENDLSFSAQGPYSGGFTITAPDGFDSYTWFIDGTSQAGSKSLTVDAAKLTNGTHSVTLRVEKDGIVYSAATTFRVQK